MSDSRETVSAATRLLKAVACELRELAHDTARFGESLTDHGKMTGNDASIRLLQKFDLFAQSLQAHAVLIEDLSGRLHTSIEGEQLDDLLRHVPFFNVRERLRAVVNGVSLEQSEEEAPDDFWFLNE
jgi:hypothetical protein